MQRTALARDKARQETEKGCRFEVGDDIRALLSRVWAGGSELADVERDLVRLCLDRADAAYAVQKLVRQSTAVSRAEEELGAIFTGHGHLSHAEIDSFLNRASAALPRSLLAWHYRSQHEALIGFCNKAFYKGELQTIPIVAELPRREPIRVRVPEDAGAFAQAAPKQPLSFHRMESSPYDSQRDPGEAVYTRGVPPHEAASMTDKRH